MTTDNTLVAKDLRGERLDDQEFLAVVALRFGHYLPWGFTDRLNQIAEWLPREPVIVDGESL